MIRQGYDKGRHETFNERMDRNWTDLLQELRVLQTGLQVLTGFLLTLPFQSRFAGLDAVQRVAYLVLVILAALTTGLALAPVSLHRALFGLQIKQRLVTVTHTIVRCCLGGLLVVLAGTAGLVFDVVLGRWQGILVVTLLLAAMAILWLVLPVVIRRRARPGVEDPAVP